MAGAVDISIVGDKELERRFHRLISEKAQVRIARLALRKSAKRIKARLLVSLSEHEDTGATIDAVERKPIATSSRRGILSAGIPLPTREEVGLSPKTNVLPVYFLEYGNLRQAATHLFTNSVDDYRNEEIAFIGRDIGKAIDREVTRQ